jgi:putative flippase GtrA
MIRSGESSTRGEATLASRLFWFSVAGFSGFLVDAGILSALVDAGLDARMARPASFFCALLVTWQINRSRTFGDREAEGALAEFVRYASASSLAALINLGIFTVLVTMSGFLAKWPVLAIAIATAISMSVNFLSYMKFVFNRRG